MGCWCSARHTEVGGKSRSCTYHWFFLCVYFCPTQWFPVSLNHLVSFKSFLKRTVVHRLEDIGGELKEGSAVMYFLLSFFTCKR